MMPPQTAYIEHEVGDVVRGYEIGKANAMRLNKFVFQACAGCGKKRWVLIERGKPRSELCHACGLKHRKQSHPSGANHPFWKGGRHTTGYGYMTIKVFPDNFFYPMATANGYILEHRLVMAEDLGRCLQPWEIVHHKNGNRLDNRIGNLELVATAGEHSIEHNKGYMDGYAKGLQDGRVQQIKELKARIAELETQLASPMIVGT